MATSQTTATATTATRTTATAGRTRWWVVAAILGLPALAVGGFLTLVAIWVMTA
ncbi:hypothetical protein [Streptomyces sp. NPDC003635]